MQLRSERALAAAVGVAGDHGLRVDEPVVLRDRANLLVHLRPAPVVARIATQTATVRTGDAWLAREVAIAGFLAERGAPVVAPSPELPPGPHERDGFHLTFWTVEEEVGPVDAHEAGARLRACHELLDRYLGALPRLGALDEAERIVRGLAADGVLDAGPVLRRTADLRGRIDALALPVQALHGDAHLGNVLQTARGPLWNDWEDAFAGPLAWDVACLRAFPRPGRDAATQAEAVRGWGEEPPGVELLLEARRLQGAVWGVVLGRARDDAAQVADALASLADGASSD